MIPWTNRSIVILAASLAIASGVPVAESASDGIGADKPAVDALFADVDSAGLPGCALAVAQQGEFLYSRGYGSANLDYDIPITPQTVFDVASITKQFVAASLNMLEAEGRLSLDDDVRDWLPELPAYEQPITLRHMIYHTSGLRDYLNLFPLAGRGDYHPISHPMILAMMARQRGLAFSPGHQYEYSNTAYMLLAQVLERAGGQSLGEFTRTRIFEPLGMNGSRMYDNKEMLIPRRATGYDRSEDGELRITHNYNFDVAGDGQLYSTVEDLLRWDDYLHGSDTPDIHDSMLVEGRLNDGEPIGYAQGLFLDEYRGLATVGHSGSSWGFRSQLLRFIEPALSIAIACNFDSSRPGDLALGVADLYLADELGPRSDDRESTADSEAHSPAPIRLPTAELEAFAGSFFSPELDATYRFSVVDDRLVVQIEQEPAVDVTPVSADRLEIRFGDQGMAGPQDASLAFERDSAGAVTGFRLSSGSERGLVFRKQPSAADTVIVNARVIDGSGDPAQRVNVRIREERIVAVGDVAATADDIVIDANGLVLAPGFVDVHSHHEDGLSEMPGALAAVSQGITTIVAGQDGSQPYPLAEFFASLELSPAAINVAAYAGHGTLRGRVMGEDYQRPASAAEIEAMAELLEAEMQAGALGLATGLEYDPGSFSTTEELIELSKVAAAGGGRYMSHIRSEDQHFWEAIEELIRIGREARLPAHISHIKLAMTRWWGLSGRLTDRLDEARESGVDVTADIYPYRAWQTGFSWLQTLFPDRDLTRRDGAEYILNDMLSPEGILLPRYYPDADYDGLTIAEIAKIRESDPETTLMALLRADVETGSRSSMLGFAMDEPDIEAIMAWPHAVIGSDGELAGAHPRGYGAFTRFLGHYVRDRNVVSLEEAIRKVSSLPAAITGISDRGAIREGYFADLVLFDPATVADRATPEEPHVPSVGIAKVWVNGQLVFDDGRVTGKRPGHPLRRSTP